MQHEVREVLPEEPGQEREREKDRRDHGQPLHHLVLVVRDLRLVVVAHARDQVARELEVGGPEQLVVGVAEVELDVVREDLVAAELDPVVDDFPDRVPGGRQRAPDVQHVVAQPREACADPLRVPLLHVVLELVDLGVDVVDKVEEAFRDVVGEVVGEHRHVVRVAARRLGRPRVPRRASVGRRLPHRGEHVSSQHDVDLLVEDRVLLGDHDRDEEDPEHVVAVRLQLRSRIVLVPGGREQLLDRAVVDIAGKLRRELLRSGVEQVDPPVARGHRGRA